MVFYCLCHKCAPDNKYTNACQNVQFLPCKNVQVQFLLAHLVYQPKSIIQSCFACHHHWHHPALASVSLSVHTSPWHMVRHRNFILGTHMHMSPIYAHQIFNDSDLVVFKWQQPLLKYLLFTYIHK